MSERVSYAWVSGDVAGRVMIARCYDQTVQNTLTFIGWARKVDLEAKCVDLGVRVGPCEIRCNREWLPSTLCPAPLAQGNVERYPWFCPVWDRDTLIAVLLKEGE